MYAKVVINIEAPLSEPFHYSVPKDLRSKVDIGHLVEVEFGRRLAQGIIVDFDDSAPVEETKPIINLIAQEPIVRSWQIKLAQWLSERYLSPLNACLRLMLPPGLTRWADVTVEINPFWDGSGKLSEAQSMLVNLLRQKGDMRGRQIARALPKGTDWRKAINQLAKREILKKASVLDPPRIKPKTVRTVTLIADKEQIFQSSMHLGRANKQADIIYFLLNAEDPLPAESTFLQSGNQLEQLEQLADQGIITRTPPATVAVPLADLEKVPGASKALYNQLPRSIDDIADLSWVEDLHSQSLVQFVEYPATVTLAIDRTRALAKIFQLRNAGSYLEILNYLAKIGGYAVASELYAATGTSLRHLRKLVETNLIRIGEERVWRDPLAERDFVPGVAPQLTADQARVWDVVKSTMVDLEEDFRAPKVEEVTLERSSDQTSFSPKPLLLHGVTGSGKTEIYLRAVEFAIQRGQQSIILVPEIALTPQTVKRFAARFPGQVAVLHSRLTTGERYDTWKRARENDFNIVIGPRSALFTPFDNLGVIVLDEEHDHSFKQTPPVPPPYYHASEVAIELGRLTGSLVIMGSATPNVVTYHKAQAGRYRLLELPKRIMGHRQRIKGQAERINRASNYQPTAGDPEDVLTIPLPPVKLVDLRQELRAGNRSIFSRVLEKEMNETLERGEQAILFLNRRGTATFIICRDCGLVLNCPRCEMPLTYHRPGAMLECHYCGRKEPPHDTCPRCGSHRIKYFGLGTEEIQRLVEIQWPEARTVRWDRDTTAGRDTHEALLASFINQEADILIGTQMIAKGLDLPLVTLVGVISADVALGLPDYNTGERTFQMLTQVAGRAGRGVLGGRVIIQTYQPEHYAIQTAAEHDYTTFYLEEIRFRTQHRLPPFRQLARLIIADPVSARAEKEARDLARALRYQAREKAMVATEVVGPLPPFFHRLKGRYRWQIIIRSPDPGGLLKDQQIPPQWVVDIDPVSTL